MELDILSSVSNYAARPQTNTQPKVAPSPSVETSGGQLAKADRQSENAAVKGVSYKTPVKTGDGGLDVSSLENFDGEVNEKKAERANEALDKAIAQINEKLQGSNIECQYSVHKQTGLINVKVLNAKTKEIVREIPPVNRLDALAKMWELAGILLDKKG